MKIGLVSPYDFSVPGGVNTHICHLADNYRCQGHNVRILAPASRRDAVERDDLIVMGQRTIGLPAGGSVAHITLSLMLGPLVDRVLAREAFDIIHIHEPFVPLLPFQVLRRSKGLTVATFHAAKDQGRQWYAYFRPAISHWWPRIQGKIAVSPAALSLIERYFEDHYEIIPNGVDYQRFATPLPPFPQFKDGKLNVLFLGRLEKRKGLPYLLQAYAQVKARLPESRLIIVGPDGGMLAGAETFVRREGLTNDVVFTGYVPEEDKPRYYRTADVFCAPNTGNESFGLILLEAMAAGTPVVASNIEGFAYVVAHEQEGLLVPPRNASALADALVQLLGDADRRREMGRRGQEKACQFAWDRVSQQVLDFYRRVAGAPGP
ncbi:MAG TPA: glycosyltransferase family 4 protein [Dehalococcoidia bacterium]|nr:glycosyltransferase family 4 protein [Dehalococcoidia bacterium]